MEIINTTDYDKDTVLRFQQFNARIVKSIPWSTHALFAFLMLSVLAGAFFAVHSHAWLDLAVLALALYVFGRRFYAIYIAPEKKFEQSSFAGLSQRYTFLKNSFIVCVNGKEDRGYYNRLFDVWETPDAFYLYANARQAYIVSKAGFEQGTAEALAAHLRGRVEAKKYKTVKR